ncbi:zinc finger MYM-type protein 4 isoform X2 [Sphaeramia orbicularis]|uniref:TRASH domain-containing protein n=1 Tax=Sphaeramia orbicularis TaxID=375764 RepID=A0A673B059_9TELE|nr:zinc finger MYM-type protein 4 isoform X2 [Sphaeramia orbicularis]
MAATETDDGHERLAANQVSSVQVTGAVRKGTDGGSIDAVSEAGESLDVEDTALACQSSLSNHREEDKLAEKEKENNEHNDTETGVGEDFTSPSETFSSEENMVVDVKTEEDFETDMNSEKSPARPDVSEEVKEEVISEFKEEMDSDSAEDTQHKNTPIGSESVDPPANALDEMMDMGTVDQVEQEAQMKEEEQDNTLDMGTSSSSPVSNTVSTAEDGNSVEEEVDVKPVVLPPPSEDDQMEDIKVEVDSMQSCSSPSSEAAVGTRRRSISPTAMMNGMKVVKLAIPKLQIEKLRSNSSSSPPLVKVKDEPVDEEYDRALISSTSTATVKDEPIPPKEDLRIGSVFSVNSDSEIQTPPTASPSVLHMSCCHCKKSLMKGQTAFQRKGSPSLFCSTACLTASLPAIKGPPKICHNCQKLILRPQDVILAPDSKGTMKDFCSQNCLTAFSFKKNVSNKMLVPTQTGGPQSLCSMCSRLCISKHEVTLNGNVHKICSDACFNRFRTMNKLSMASCAFCGAFYGTKPLLLKLEDSSKTLCNLECLNKFKEKTKTSHTCTMCRSTRTLAEMVYHKNSDDSVNLFCSSSCIMAYKVQTVSTSGARLSCDFCWKNTVPSYHLAMSDTSIRNFCTLPCVMAFQEKFKKSQPQLSVFTKLPVGSTQNQTVTPAQVQIEASHGKLNCSQCSQSITFKPEVIQIKDKMVFVCSTDCAHEFKKANFVTSLCEYCKIEKLTRDAKRINNKDCFFCSDGCKLLYRHDLTKSWGKHCHSCSYCHSVSKKLVTAQYGGSAEEFCSEECRSKYTMLFCHVAKCDTCGRKAKLKQSLSLLGDVKHFCDLSCLLKYCSWVVEKQGEVFPKDTEELKPVIASVMSLASPQAAKPKTSEGTAQQSTATAQTKYKRNISIQTDTTKVPPPAPPKVLKNKALLCRPLVQNKGVSCRTQTVDTEVQTDETIPKVLVLPIPVPVYVPVPMGMYTQCTPKPMGLPLPLPVPMFLPVTMSSAEGIVETIKDIKEKIPSDPFEAELILMAEMVAEQDEGKSKEKVENKETNKQSGPDDHTSNFSDDLDTDDLASFLNNWDDPTPDAGLQSPGRPYAHEKLNPVEDVPEGHDTYPEPVPQAPPPLDLEADFSVEMLERMSRLIEEAEQPPSPPPTGTRRQAHRKARDKNKGRKAQRSKKGAEAASQKGSSHKGKAAEVQRLKSHYGVDAWKRWIQWRQTQPNLQKPSFASRPLDLKQDVLRCTTAELSYGLCCFITEVKRPNGEPYSTDSLFYLCLGIQQHLFENGRVENIFMDRFYSKFSTEFTQMLKGFKPAITGSGYIHSRVEEEFLWDCKQLGAYSPIVLLNTLLFFCCKYFRFTTVEQHRQLSFAHVMRCTKTNANNTKTTFLRFYPPLAVNEAESEPDAKKPKFEENKEEILEMMENTENPLRCPVRLYEFYLSKCSESVKQRTNLFYLHPERCCVPNSPLWFSSTPLDDSTMEAMLIRILTVRELHLRTREDREMETSDDKPYVPDEDEADSD